MVGNIVEFYRMWYDNNTKEDYLGTFEILQLIYEDGWNNQYIGKNINTNEICIITGYEVTGIKGGTRYDVVPIKNEIINPNHKNTKIITLCGSSKFIDEIKYVAEALTLKGYIVLTPAIFDNHNFFTDPSKISDKEHVIYDKIHQYKMLMSDFVLIINPNGYIGDNTKEEIEFCKNNGIPVKKLVKG